MKAAPKCRTPEGQFGVRCFGIAFSSARGRVGKMKAAPKCRTPEGQFGVRCLGIAFSSARGRVGESESGTKMPHSRGCNLECDVLASLSFLCAVESGKVKAAPKCRTPEGQFGVRCFGIAFFFVCGRVGESESGTKMPHSRGAIWSAMFWHRFLFVCGRVGESESGTKMPHCRSMTIGSAVFGHHAGSLPFYNQAVSIPAGADHSP